MMIFPPLYSVVFCFFLVPTFSQSATQHTVQHPLFSTSTRKLVFEFRVLYVYVYVFFVCEESDERERVSHNSKIQITAILTLRDNVSSF